MEIMELEGIVKQYPWFSYARHILLLRLAAIGEDIFEEQLRSSAVFLSSRSALYRRLYQKDEHVGPSETASYVGEIPEKRKEPRCLSGVG